MALILPRSRSYVFDRSFEGYGEDWALRLVTAPKSKARAESECNKRFIFHPFEKLPVVFRRLEEKKPVCLTLTVRKPLSVHGTPFYRYSANAVEGLFEMIARANQREAKIVFSVQAERRARNRRDASLLQQKFLNFFSGKAGVIDIHPRIKCAFRRMAAESGNLCQRLHEEIAAEFVFGDHGVYGIRGVAQSFDGGDLGKFGGAGEGVQNEKVHRIDDVNRSDRVTEPPAGHRKTF